MACRPDAVALEPPTSSTWPNAHGPNEFLHLPTARRLTAAVALVLDAHAGQSGSGPEVDDDDGIGGR